MGLREFLFSAGKFQLPSNYVIAEILIVLKKSEVLL